MWKNIAPASIPAWPDRQIPNGGARLSIPPATRSAANPTLRDERCSRRGAQALPGESADLAIDVARDGKGEAGIHRGMSAKQRSRLLPAEHPHIGRVPRLQPGLDIGPGEDQPTRSDRKR